MCTEHIYILLVNNLVMLSPQLASLQNFEENFLESISQEEMCVNFATMNVNKKYKSDDYSVHGG